MEAFVWAAIGAAIGWVAGGFAAGRTYVSRVEDVLAGVFGAFIGGDFLFHVVTGKAAGTGGFTIGALAAAVGCAIVTVMLLALMRRVVGPMRPSKKKVGARF
jgi:uncharacterized membrane protein YeaQ/YmgE (transglycosylase-associated protein family)